MFRYAKRTLQKEVSHIRTLVVAGVFAVSYGYRLLVGIDEIATRVDGTTFEKIGIATHIASGLTFLIMGLLVGIGLRQR